MNTTDKKAFLLMRIESVSKDLYAKAQDGALAKGSESDLQYILKQLIDTNIFINIYFKKKIKMKIEKKESPQLFKPFDIVITVESDEEREMLWLLSRMNISKDVGSKHKARLFGFLSELNKKTFAK